MLGGVSADVNAGSLRVAPASCRLSRGRLALAAAFGKEFVKFVENYGA
jgi:hypothetical protein